ncbi:MAG: serine/threonine-protein kinase [Polyangiaceae bacterium]
MSSENDADKPNETAQTEIDPKSFRDPREISSRAVSVLGIQTFSARASKDPKVKAIEAQEFEDRYQSRTKLGEGGMGEVRLCRDGRIGRDVAMKVIRTDRHPSSEMRARFLREVRVQGQLEHPSIVPVYDLGTGKDGETYFTMKRVRGQNLADILDGIRLGDPAAIEQHSQRKLLAAFQSVCLAIEFAHSRGVLHRDLKPTNIMLGAFGEVYVLDWGIAKIMNEDESEGPASKVQDSDPSLETQVGAFVGTLGYL